MSSRLSCPQFHNASERRESFFDSLRLSAHLLKIVRYTMAALEGVANPPWPALKPLRGLLEECYSLTSTRAYRSLPPDLGFERDMARIISIFLHSRHPEGRRVRVLKGTDLALYCTLPWIACQARVNGTCSSPCAPTSVLNKTTLAFSGLSMCAKVRACPCASPPDHL